MKDQYRSEMSDAELDQVLREATSPRIPLGAEGRLVKRLAVASPVAVAIRPRSFAWLSALPLAASLVLGIYLGTTGYGTDMFATTVATTESDIITGIEEAELAAEEDVT
jgi:hypothetical protein